MEDSPQIDFTKIAFPSDSLTIGTLRKLHPADLDSQSKPDFTERSHSLGAELTDMLWVEREIAEAAFNRALGRPTEGDRTGQDWQDCLDQVAGIYTRYGIASGQHHAEQLFRDIETQAVAQARQHGGRQP